MNSNLIRYRKGRKVLVRANDWHEGRVAEVLILDKSASAVKVEALTDDWWCPGKIIWLSVDMYNKEYWWGVSSVGWG